MNDQIRQLVTKHYKVAPVSVVSPVEAGFLSHNFIIETTEQKFFFKQYRFSDLSRIQGIHRAKFFFADAGVPVILPIQNKHGETILQSGEQFFTLFPFVAGHQFKRGHLSQVALGAMARMQAQIHRAGANIHLHDVQTVSMRKSYQEFVEMAQLLLSKIPKENETAFDVSAREALRLKIRLAEQNRSAIEDIDMASDHLVHGDYQDGNVFFDQHDTLSHVFDWERTRVAPRSFNLGRAIEMVCFGQADTYVPNYSSENFQQARHYLAAYHDVYPVSQREFREAARVRYLHEMISLWVETAHYLETNDRVDVFLESDCEVLRYHTNNFDEYVERICQGIL